MYSIPVYYGKPKTARPCTFNRSYIPLGYLRLLIICSTLGGWIAATTVFRNKVINNQYSSVQAAYLVISLATFLVSICIVFLNCCNIVDFTRGIAGKCFIIFLDLFFALGLIGISVAAAVMEGKLPRSDQTLKSEMQQIIRYNAFAIAAAFGCFSGILLYISAVWHIFV